MPIIGNAISILRHRSGSSGPNGAPSNPTLVVDSDTQMTVSWTNGATNQDGSKVYISTDNVTFTLKGTVVGNGTSFAVTGLTSGTLYYFYVVHYKGTTESAASNTVSDATTISSPSDIANLEYWIGGRSGLTIPNKVTPGTNDGTIQMPYVVFNPTNLDYGNSLVTVPNPANGYLEALIYLVGGEAQNIFTSADKDTNLDYLCFGIDAGKHPYMIFRRGVTTAFYNIMTCNDAIATDGWHTIRYGSNGTGYYFLVDGNSVNFTASTGTNDGKWFSSVVNRENIGFAAIMRSTPITGVGFRVAWIKLDTTNHWVLNNSFMAFDVIGGLHVQIFGTYGLERLYYGNTDTHLLDYGYTLYKNDFDDTFQVPHNVAGNQLSGIVIPDSYSFVREVAGNANYHNLATSEITIPGASWDRSDITICSTAARRFYYDVTIPKQWPIRNLFKRDMNDIYFNTNYKGRSFVKIVNNSVTDRQYLSELFNYTANKTGANLTNILNYTNDNNTPTVTKYSHIIYEGHSIIRGLGYLDYTDIPTGARNALATLHNKVLFSASFAVSGSTIAAMVARKAASIDPYYFASTTVNRILVIMIGTNDITSTIGTATSTYNTLHSFLDSCIADGWTVIPCTMTRRGDIDVEATRVAYNNLIKGNADFTHIADMDLISQLNDPNDTTYFMVDKVHPNEVTKAIIGQFIANIINAL